LDRKVKLKALPLDSAIETLVATGLFRKFNLSNPSDLPQHLIFCGTEFYFYLDHDLPFYLKRGHNPHLDEYVRGRGTKWTIVDFSVKSRPEISMEGFMNRLPDEKSGKFLFYLDLFT